MASGRRVSPISRKQPTSRWGTFTTTSRRRMRSARPLWSNVYWNCGRCRNSGTRGAPPKERLLACIENTFENRDLLARGGCPVGTLCSELHKEGGPLAKKATALFTELLGWIEDQFRAIGRGDTSRKLATQLLSSLQGVSVLAHGSGDPELVAMETKRLKDWVGGL